MPRSKTKLATGSNKATATKATSSSEPPPLRPTEWSEVLTLAEAAAYLRVPEAEVVRMVGPRGLPGRLIGSEWRFSRTAIERWLQAPPQASTKESLLSLTGAWKDDPDVDDMLKEIYRRRGRPMTEDAS